MPSPSIPGISSSKRARKQGQVAASVFARTNNYLTLAAFRRCCLIFAGIALLEYSFEFIQSFFSGNYLGETALAALGLGFPICRLITVIEIFLVSGSNILGLQAKGQRDNRAINEIFTLTLILCVLASCICTPLLCLLAPWIASSFSSDAEVVQQLSAYLFALGFYMLPLCVSRTLREYIIMDGGGRCVTFSSAIEMCVRVGSMLLCLLVWNMGIISMAVSICIGAVACILTCCTHFLKAENTLALAKPTHIKQRVMSICKLSAPETCQVFLDSVFVRACLNAIVQAVGGTSAVAVVTIVNSVFGIMKITPKAYERALVFFGGCLHGERDALGLENTFYNAVKDVIVITVVTGIVVVALSGIIPSWFAVTDAHAVSILQASLIACAIALPFFSVTMQYLSCLRGVGRAKSALLYAMLFAILPLPVSCLLVPLLDAPGMYWAYLVSDLCILCIVAITSYRHMRKAGRRYITIQDLLLLGDDFAKTHQESYRLSVPYDKVSSKRIADMLPPILELAPRDTRRLRLCIEELSLSALERSRRKESVKRFFELQIDVEPDRVTLTTKDLSRRTSAFTHDELTSLSVRDDPGLVIVRDISDDVDYRFVRGLNVITVTLMRSSQSEGENKSEIESESTKTC